MIEALHETLTEWITARLYFTVWSEGSEASSGFYEDLHVHAYLTNISLS